MHPFAELTNKTPSPCQKEESSYNRKHSPWTAARHKKKTRSVQQQSGDTLPVYQQVIPEACSSPTAAATAAVAAPEYSFGDVLCSGSQATASPHSSPPVSKCSAEDADVHPSKAYIPDPQACNSPQKMELGSAGGLKLSAAAAAAGHAGAGPRSPVWLQSSPLNGDLSDTAAGCSFGHALQACSSAPATGNLFERFDQAAQQQDDVQQHNQQPILHQQHSFPCQPVPLPPLPPQQQQHSSAVQGVGVVRGRRLTARRGSWGGADQLHRSLAGNSLGGSRLAAVSAQGGSNSSSLCFIADAQDSIGCSWQQQQQPVLHQHTSSHPAAALVAAGACSLHSDEPDFQLHSRLSHIDGTDIQPRRRSFGSGLLQRWQGCAEEESGVDGGWCVGAAAAHAAGWGEAGSGSSDDGALEWYEARMQETVDGGGDVAVAQQLWTSMRATGLKPSLSFLNYFLMCCHYSGSDPADAQDAVREMCTAADLEPDGLTARLLAAIDIGWQQLQCSLG